MAKRRKNVRKILVAENISMKAARDLIAGVLRYAAPNSAWNVFVYGGHQLDHDFMRKFSRPDGIITGYSPDDPMNPVPQDLRLHIPTVFTCVMPQPGMKAPHATINADDRAIGKVAAKCFLRNKLNHFAFIGAREETFWQKTRLESFREAAQAEGREVSVFQNGPESESWDEERERILAWIWSLPKPCGVFTAYDPLARNVLDICREAGILIPSQVQILGVDNETYFCEYSVPTMSSISPDFEGGGYLAAQTLDALMGRRPRPRTNHFGISEIVERASTSDISGAGNRVSQARSIICGEFKTPLTVACIAHRIGCSVRLLEKDFHTVLGHTVIGEIRNVRMSKALDMLKHTHYDEKTIAVSCGYGSVGTLRNIFRATHGMTMRKWREAAR